MSEELNRSLDFADLVIDEKVALEEEPMKPDEMESKMIELTTRFVLHDKEVPKIADLKLFAACPAGCELKVSKGEDGKDKWEGILLFSTSEIRHYTKSDIVGKLKEQYSKYPALLEVETPEFLPCTEANCGDVDMGESNCPVHDHISKASMVMMVTRRFAQTYHLAQKKVFDVGAGRGVDHHGLADSIKLGFPCLSVREAGLDAGYSYGNLMSFNQVLTFMRVTNAGIKKQIIGGRFEILLDLTKAMLGGKKAPKVIRGPDATKQGPEVEFKNTVANIRGSLASGRRVDNPKLNMKRGKRAARLHDRDPVVEQPPVDKKARGVKRKSSAQADNLFELNTTNYSEVSHYGKASKTWCDLVCSQRVTSVT